MTKIEIVKMLRDNGHFPVKAREIATNYEQGDPIVVKYISDLIALLNTVK